MFILLLLYDLNDITHRAIEVVLHTLQWIKSALQKGFSKKNMTGNQNSVCQEGKEQDERTCQGRDDISS